jgi:acyl-CoA dehydrogenase
MSVPVPFSEPPYLCGLPSAYYTEKHRKWQAAIRPFIQKNLVDHALEWEREGTVPGHVWETFGKAGMLLPALPAPLPVEWLKRLGIHEIYGGLKVEDFDYLHHLIYTDEMARCGTAGPASSLTAGVAFGVPPVLKFGSKEVQERFLPGLLRGEKRSCIAITEPEAGSDVANITTTAVRDGNDFVINGTKKWYIPNPPSPAFRPIHPTNLATAGSPTVSGPTTPPWRCGRARRAAGPRASACWWCR